MNQEYKKRNKNKKFTHIKFPLKDIVTPITHDDGMFKEVEYIWSQIGDDISANTAPISFKNSILVVKVSSSPWMQQLQFMKLELIDFINASFGEKVLHDIKFRLG